MVITGVISKKTGGNADMLDITRDVASIVAESKVKNGIVTVFTPGSTCALTTIEYEPGCLSDLQRVFDEIVDPRRNYAHNATWGDGNGYSHVRAALLGPSLTVPFSDQRLLMGTWQQIIFVDFDNRPRQRQIVVQVMGEN